MPILKKDLPQDAVLLKSVMAPSIKKSHDIDNLYTFKIRHTLNDKPMQQGVHFDESYSPSCAMDSVKCGLGHQRNMKGVERVMLITAFKQLFDLLIPKKKRKFATVPNFFQTWFERKYNVKFPGPPKECAIPLFTNM